MPHAPALGGGVGVGVGLGVGVGGGAGVAVGFGAGVATGIDGIATVSIPDRTGRLRGLRRQLLRDRVAPCQEEGPSTTP